MKATKNYFFASVSLLFCILFSHPSNAQQDNKRNRSVQNNNDQKTETTVNVTTVRSNGSTVTDSAASQVINKDAYNEKIIYETKRSKAVVLEPK